MARLARAAAHQASWRNASSNGRKSALLLQLNSVARRPRSELVGRDFRDDKYPSRQSHSLRLGRGDSDVDGRLHAAPFFAYASYNELIVFEHDPVQGVENSLLQIVSISVES